jgi:hypothetical protein
MVCFSANPHHLRRRECRSFQQKSRLRLTRGAPAMRSQSNAAIHRYPYRHKPLRSLTIAPLRPAVADSRNPNSGSHQRSGRAVERPLRARGQSTPKRALPMKPLGLNLAIPSAVRSGFAIQLSAWPAHRQPLGAMLRVFKAMRHPHLGPIPCPQTSRFRAIFQVLFCRGPMLRAHALWAASARGTPIRSGRGADGASPAAVNNAATRSAWLAPSSTINVPPGASSAGAAPAIAR